MAHSAQTPEPRAAFLRALEKLEKEATQPVVPGELVPWARAVGAALAELDEARAAAEKEWEDTTRRILEEDPELARRVERLREKEEALAERLKRLRRRDRRLWEAHLEEAASASEELLDVIQELRQELLAWIVDAKGFDADLRTWLVESVYRDRGIAD